MKEKHQPTIVAAIALLSLAFLFLMTATEGDYWPSDVDEYIVVITEGEGQSYLDADTPTAMVVTARSIPFNRRNCLQRGTCPITENCYAVDNGYIISDGVKYMKATKMRCTSVQPIERTPPPVSKFARSRGYNTRY